MKALKTTLLASALFAALGMGSAQANIVDLFNDPANFTSNRVWDESVGAGGCTAGAVNGGGCFQEYGPATNVLGGFRDLYVESKAQTTGAPSTRMYAGGGVLSFSNDSGTTGYGAVQWDGQDNSSALSHTHMDANLIHQQGCGDLGCVKFVAGVLLADQGFEYKITLIDTNGDWATLAANTLFPIPPGGVYNSEYFFDWFNLAAGSYVLDGLPFVITRSGVAGDVDFQHIGGMQLELNTNAASPAAIAVDLQLASVTKRPVPEPGALALVGIGLFGAGVASRARKAAKK